MWCSENLSRWEIVATKWGDHSRVACAWLCSGQPASHSNAPGWMIIGMGRNSSTACYSVLDDGSWWTWRAGDHCRRQHCDSTMNHTSTCLAGHRNDLEAAWIQDMYVEAWRANHKDLIAKWTRLDNWLRCWCRRCCTDHRGSNSSSSCSCWDSGGRRWSALHNEPT